MMEIMEQEKKKKKKKLPPYLDRRCPPVPQKVGRVLAGANNAADLVSLVQGPADDLAAQGARPADNEERVFGDGGGARGLGTADGGGLGGRGHGPARGRGGDYRGRGERAGGRGCSGRGRRAGRGAGQARRAAAGGGRGGGRATHCWWGRVSRAVLCCVCVCVFRLMREGASQTRAGRALPCIRVWRARGQARARAPPPHTHTKKNKQTSARARASAQKG